VLGKYDEAMKAYDKAIEINPYNETASIKKMFYLDGL
jgi:tetratricopeptide (TPR) repeat protein